MVSVTDQTTGASSKDQLDIPNWLATLATSHSTDEVALIRRACETAERVHGGQPRESGEPYLQHVLAVANILIDLRLDHETIAAALLHDVLEDGTVKLELIEHDFGARVARLVDGVAKMRLIHNLHSEGKKEQHQAETLRKMLLAMADDVRVVLIKLAECTHNMRTLDGLPEEQRRRIDDETLAIYAPLANRLGIWHIKWELEDLALRHLHQDVYKQIAGMLNERRVDRERYIKHFMKTLAGALAQAGIKAEITGRPKHIYSIWRKMSRKNLDYSQIYDVFAPNGDSVDLPRGATPLDFAYHIHTELGLRTLGAKVNGSMVQLTSPLQTGQQVELLTVKKGAPSRDWLNPHLGYLKTSRARAKVHSWFKQQNVEANVAAGRTAFEKELQRLGFSAVSFEDVARRLHFPKTDALFAAIGRGEVKPTQVVSTVQQIRAPVADPQA